MPPYKPIIAINSSMDISKKLVAIIKIYSKNIYLAELEKFGL